MNPHRFVIALVAVMSVAEARADEAVASLAQIEGNVLVSTGAEMASVTTPMRLVAGMRVLPSWRSSAVVLFDDGCRVEIEAGERYVVESRSPCLVAAIESQPNVRDAGR